MEEYINSQAFDLSLGQKQRFTIAGVLSIKPKYIVMDEPTAMLDPEGKEDVRKAIKKLKQKGFTIIYITNILNEIFLADRIILIEKGRIIKEFKKEEILKNIEFLKSKGIAIPKILEKADKLEEVGIKLEGII